MQFCYTALRLLQDAVTHCRLWITALPLRLRLRLPLWIQFFVTHYTPHVPPLPLHTMLRIYTYTAVAVHIWFLPGSTLPSATSLCYHTVHITVGYTHHLPTHHRAPHGYTRTRLPDSGFPLGSTFAVGYRLRVAFCRGSHVLCPGYGYVRYRTGWLRISRYGLVHTYSCRLFPYRVCHTYGTRSVHVVTTFSGYTYRSHVVTVGLFGSYRFLVLRLRLVTAGCRLHYLRLRTLGSPSVCTFTLPHSTGWITPVTTPYAATTVAHVTVGYLPRYLPVTPFHPHYLATVYFLPTAHYHLRLPGFCSPHSAGYGLRLRLVLRVWILVILQFYVTCRILQFCQFYYSSTARCGLRLPLGHGCVLPAGSAVLLLVRWLPFYLVVPDSRGSQHVHTRLRLRCVATRLHGLRLRLQRTHFAAFAVRALRARVCGYCRTAHYAVCACTACVPRACTRVPSYGSGYGFYRITGYCRSGSYDTWLRSYRSG